ncbi:3-hydroxybutyryl-CoA dehydrogenase [Halomonas halocynthiae]|uniref:3-hydroxybutyryl-CoA dehydrogenase n=1 Tax=Halomonas halocynthiae TaxID=176290 RepID=UPI00041E394D|nr:3-hydroxybutyryl-CoA dehydrogenase [Halomonas halocynthiae]
MQKPIIVLGAGRMGEGIALSFVLAGQDVVLVDFKPREASERERYYEQARSHLMLELAYLRDKGLLQTENIAPIASRLRFIDHQEVVSLMDGRLVFEALPEVREIKQKGLSWASRHLGEEVVIASTTSTFLVSELSSMVSNSARFMNAHWLNPAHLMPLVEVSRSKETEPRYIDELYRVLKGIGKVPVLCEAAPGYIVPRLQVLLMNEAARLVEEGVASAEDVDVAIRVGLGLRYSVLGVLEFIDWGGGDTLYYASNYLCDKLDDRFKSPDVITQNMQKQRRGFQDGAGFFDYTDVDLKQRRRERSGDFLKRLALLDLMPEINASGDTQPSS